MSPTMITNSFWLSPTLGFAFLLLTSSAVAFLMGSHDSMRRECMPSGCLRKRGDCYPFALGAGGFGKSPAKPTSSSKNQKKNTNKRRNKASAKVPSYIPYDSKSLDDEFDLETTSSQRKRTSALIEWLDEEEVEGLDALEIGFSRLSVTGEANSGGKHNLLRGVFAKENIRAGEYIMAVPYVTTLLVDEDFDATSEPSGVVLRADEPEVGFQFWKKFYNSGDADSSGNFQSFLDCLPLSPEDPNFDGTPDFWSEQDIRQLEIPGVIEKMLSRKKAISKLSQRLLDEKDNCTESSALSTIQQCCWIVQSRAFTTYKKAIDLLGTKGLLSRVVLIPFIDTINHASRKHANAEMQVIETKEYNESFYALVARANIPKGKEVRICYGTGEESSLELFCKYGFLPNVEDVEKERVLLERMLEGVEWSTTLKEDKAMLLTEKGRNEPLRTILSIRIYAKTICA